MLGILSYPVSSIGLAMVGPGEEFQNKSFQNAGKHYFETGNFHMQ